MRKSGQAQVKEAVEKSNYLGRTAFTTLTRISGEFEVITNRLKDPKQEDTQEVKDEGETKQTESTTDESQAHVLSVSEEGNKKSEEDSQEGGLEGGGIPTAASITELGTESGVDNEEPVKEDLVLPLDPVFTGDAQQFIEFMKVGIPLAKTKNIFPSVMMGQALLESDRGLSELTTTNHNLFGIKGTYNGQGSTWKTLEDTGSGELYTINDTFRAYPDYYTSITDYIDLLNWEHYVNAGVTEAKTPEEQIQAIKDAGYATDSLYVSKVMALITDYNLTQYDR